MANKIEQIIEEAYLASFEESWAKRPKDETQPQAVVRHILTALDAAGLAVVAVHATADQVMQAPSNVPQDDCCRVYAQMVAAFDPSTYEPTEQPTRIGAMLTCGTCERPFDPEQVGQTVCRICMESGLGSPQ